MVHRLDKETSGVMVLARNPDAHRDLNQAFRDRQVSKKYHALVAPKPEWREKNVDLPLRTDADRQHRTRVDHIRGKPVVSKLAVKKLFQDSALLEIEILTGVTHQIRAHLRAFDLAILGDDLYSAGLGPQPATTPRMMLHAREISFTHPATGARHHFTAPYPDDFREAYQLLRSTRDPDAWI
jgi:RluA family pseudouridine synthase